MKTIECISASNGIAIGKATKIIDEQFHISNKKISYNEIEKELIRFRKSVDQLHSDIDNLISELDHSQENKDILQTHKAIISDPEMHKKISVSVSEDLFSLEHAINEYFKEVISYFQNLDNKFYSARSSDYKDVANRFLRYLLGSGKRDCLASVEIDSILIFHTITPSIVAQLSRKKISGICVEKGSKNSHSSIIARSLSIPLLVNCPGLYKNIKNGQQVILDGYDSILIISPDQKTIKKYSNILKQEKDKEIKLHRIINNLSQTSDRKRIKLMSNIELPEEIHSVLKNKSEGIGLFRTEFLFMGRALLPEQEEQEKIYRQIAESLAPQPVVIRTIDIGGDKLSDILNIRTEENPNLGCRGIRLSFENIKIFETQIRAIIKANTKGNIRIMFPMVSDIKEIIKAKEIVQKIRYRLNAEKRLEIGAMIEIPSAALTSDLIAEECDFLSIGTNDLIQYTLAVDRDNEQVADYYNSYHPSVLRLIQMTIQNAHTKNKQVAVCGELASDPFYLPLLIGLGIDELSVSPGLLLTTKKRIMSINSKNAEDIVKKCLKARKSTQITTLLRNFKTERVFDIG